MITVLYIRIQMCKGSNMGDVMKRCWGVDNHSGFPGARDVCGTKHRPNSLAYSCGVGHTVAQRRTWAYAACGEGEEVRKSDHLPK